MRVLITGAAGGVATLLRPRLRREGRILRLLDITALGASDDEEVMTASVTDPEAMAVACHDVDAVIHLGGHSRETSWAETVEVNITGPQTVLEAARKAGVPRVILASSNHAVGFREVAEAPLAADSTPRPDTFYGVSKAAIEALGSLYHSRFGMDVICVRIGSCFERPPGYRGLTTWLSPDDAGRLFDACLTFPSPGYRIIWGVSDNTRRIYSLAEAEALGYRSLDDAEKFAGEITDPAPTGPVARYVGGPFTTTPLGLPN
ncbi:NAD(P)-dependent oxidoreductase [Amycolatopsis sp. GM8]|uniref:NAD-dependent epimerase/dehydratase family protein n=1 Tax=Amycolatopsis sp. GM8 TaxID=2896530 RepID=UPI001F36659C|nr:NAD(P)-dependent oxidoreductase [Amycolatopsis sp. GM8]